MEQQLAALYGKLANQIADMIPADWDKVFYLGEIEPEKASWSSVFYFRDPRSEAFFQSNNIPKLFQVPKSAYMSQWRALNDSLLEIYQRFAGRGQPLWEQLSFSLEPSGKFHADFRYDVMNPQDGGQLARELVWAHRTFGYLPEEGTFQRQLLAQHLS